MVQTLKVSSFIAIIACAQLSCAFVVQRSTFLVPATPFSQVGIREHREVMFMAANNDETIVADYSNLAAGPDNTMEL